MAERDSTAAGSKGLGLGLGARFALATSLALLAVALVGGYLIIGGASALAERHTDELLDSSLELSADSLEHGWRATSSQATRRGRIVSQPVVVDGERPAIKREIVVEVRGRGQGSALLMIPAEVPPARDSLAQLVWLILGGMVAVGIAVAYIVARQATRPLEDLIQGVRQMSGGNYRWRARERGGAEVALLSRSLERLSEELAAAEEAELELESREHELSVAAELREALLPLGTPLIEGHDVAALHLPSAGLSGAFHDFVETADGRVGLIVCDVSGAGAPAAILGALARATLSGALESIGSATLAPDQDPLAQTRAAVSAALAHANGKLAASLKRGTFVTALFALIDPAGGRATVACAGHRLPLLRLSAEDGALRTFQPEGIALGLDRGAVFERTLAVQDLALAPGDRLVLATAGAAAVRNAAGDELETKRFFARVAAAGRAGGDAHAFLRGIRAQLLEFAAGESFPDGISLVTIERAGGPPPSSEQSPS